MNTSDWPSDLELVRTTPEFTETTVPAGLLAEHRVAAGVWGRLVVRTGELRFVFDDDADGANPGELVGAGGQVVIPPELPHHVVIVGPVVFVVEFHRPAERA